MGTSRNSRAWIAFHCFPESLKVIGDGLAELVELGEEILGAGDGNRVYVATYSSARILNTLTAEVVLEFDPKQPAAGRGDQGEEERFRERLLCWRR